MPTEPELKGPWTARVDPDGPTEILNAEGKVVATVEPEYAALFVMLPELLAVPESVIYMAEGGYERWKQGRHTQAGKILKALTGLSPGRRSDTDAIVDLHQRIKGVMSS